MLPVHIVVAMARRAICGLLLICAVLVAGCGSSDDSAQTTATKPGTVAGPAEKVIRGWADALRSGNIERAASYFAVPATVSNSGAPIKLLSKAEVEFFNTTLPCGAKVRSTTAVAHGLTLTTFELTERPGAGRCGSGTGRTAHVAIRVRKGKITEWRRANDPAKVQQQTA
jgi:hypothetical protein